jgi:hypothetical protein
MTTAGKLLTFVNLFFGVGLLTWALSAYSTGTDWADAKSDAGTEKGQITLLTEEVTRLTKAVADAQAGYGVDRDALRQEEGDRIYRKQGLDRRLEVARKDLNAKAGSFTEQLPQVEGQTYPPANRPGNPAFTDLSRTGRPIPGPDGKTPLRGLLALQEDFAREVQEAQRLNNGQEVTQAEWGEVRQGVNPQRFDELVKKMGINDLLKLHEELSVQIKRADDAVLAQKEIRENLREEARFLADSRTNWVVQLATLDRRQQQLRARLAQLGVAKADAR